MLSLFRQSGTGGRPDGNILLLAVLDPSSERHSTLTRVSRSLVENFLHEAPNRISEREFDGKIVAAYLDEIAESGPPRPIRLDEVGMESAASDLSLRWNDVRFSADGEGFEIAFTWRSG